MKKFEKKYFVTMTVDEIDPQFSRDMSDGELDVFWQRFEEVIPFLQTDEYGRGTWWYKELEDGSDWRLDFPVDYKISYIMQNVAI